MIDHAYPHRIAGILSQLGVSLSYPEARGLVLHEEATDLVKLDIADPTREYWLTPATAEAWRRMQAAAHAAGIDFFVVSAFRSVARQLEIIERKLERGIAMSDILRVSALPGYSEHHTGRAIDIGTAGSPVLEEVFEETSSYAWLAEHAHEFGFHLSYPRGNASGYDYEPWHWCFHRG